MASLLTLGFSLSAFFFINLNTPKQTKIIRHYPTQPLKTSILPLHLDYFPFLLGIPSVEASVASTLFFYVRTFPNSIEKN